jgi:hypothetical protein
MKKLLILLVLPALAGVAFADEPAPLLSDSIFVVEMRAGDRVIGNGSATYTDKGLLTCFHVVDSLGAAYYKAVPGKPLEVLGHITGWVVDGHGADFKIREWVRLHEDVVRLILDVEDGVEAPAYWAQLKWAAAKGPGQPVKAVGWFAGDLAVAYGRAIGTVPAIGPAGLCLYLVSSAPVGPGMSGSAVLNVWGELLGITCWISGGGSGAAMLD